MKALQMLAVIGSASLMAPAFSQMPVPHFNIDAGSNVAFGLPAPTYSAATFQTGVWSSFDMLGPQPFALTDITGIPSPITVNVSGSYSVFEFDNPDTPPGSDLEALMDDLMDIGTGGATTTWQFNNVPAGTYRVTVYSWAPDSPPYVTTITVTGGAVGPQACGGAVNWPGFIYGVTYAQDTVVLAAPGTITFKAQVALSSADFGSINAVQIEPGQSTVLPTTYCTAKTNSLNCHPAIGFGGTASASASSGFPVSGRFVRNNRPGLLFYGINGGAATPFQGGTLCVSSPIKRTSVVNSAGYAGNDCSGVYSIDMNAFAHSSGPPAPLPALRTPGTIVNCQWWGPDPGFPAPNDTTLTNGLQYFVNP